MICKICGCHVAKNKQILKKQPILLVFRSPFNPYLLSTSFVMTSRWNSSLRQKTMLRVKLLSQNMLHQYPKSGPTGPQPLAEKMCGLSGPLTTVENTHGQKWCQVVQQKIPADTWPCSRVRLEIYSERALPLWTYHFQSHIRPQSEFQNPPLL